MRTPGEFATALFGERLPEGTYVATWALRGKRSGWWKAPGALDYLAGRDDVFVGAALSGADHGTGQRLKARQAIAIPGVWIDVDVNGAPDNRGGVITDGAPDLDAAIDLARTVLEPTLVVCSGHGAHAWHLLRSPWYFHDIDEQHAGATLAAQWVALHQQHAHRRGFTIDSVGDLARIMRPPGTVNTKGGRRADVHALIADGARYELAELAEQTRHVAHICPPITALEATTVDVTDLRLSRARTPPAGLLQALVDNSPEFREVWFHERPDFDGDQSSYDLALAHYAARARWTDQQIADLIGYHRGWDAKCFRTGRVRGQHGYIAATIARARESAAATPEPVT
jgi:hypothetical protein